MLFCRRRRPRVVATGFRDAHWVPSRAGWLAIFSATASQGILGAMTNGGLGIAFFAPFDDTRYFFPFRPLAVSSFSVEALITATVRAILRNEMLWIKLPSLLIMVLLVGRRQ